MMWNSNPFEKLMDFVEKMIHFPILKSKTPKGQNSQSSVMYGEKKIRAKTSSALQDLARQPALTTNS
jgi:hypothetical protein